MQYCERKHESSTFDNLVVDPLLLMMYNLMKKIFSRVNLMFDLCHEAFIICCSYSVFLFSTSSSQGQNCTGMCLFPVWPSRLWTDSEFCSISPGCDKQIEIMSYGRYRNQFRKAEILQNFVINDNEDNNYNNVQPVFLVSFFER